VSDDAFAAAELAKMQAETEEITARSQRAARLMERHEDLSELRRRVLAAEAEEAETSAATRLLTLDQLRRSEASEAAKDEHNGTYRFFGSVVESSVRLCMQRLTEWDATNPDRDITIVFTSGGGDVINGLALFDFISSKRKPGRTIRTVSLGWAASMAGILLQAGDVRIMGREAWLMIHEASFEAEGKTGEIETRVEWVKAVQERVLGIFAARSGMSVTSIRNKWRNKDWYIDSAEALKLHLIDEVL
jgi:ATP-dependent Clp endopeptidase proteolytic subunit ClpP